MVGLFDNLSTWTVDKYIFKDNESSSDVGWSSTQSSTNASPLHQGKIQNGIFNRQLANVFKTYGDTNPGNTVIRSDQFETALNPNWTNWLFDFHFGFYYFEKLL